MSAKPRRDRQSRFTIVKDRLRNPGWVEVAGLLIGLAGVVVAIIALPHGSGHRVRGPAKLLTTSFNVKDVQMGPRPRPQIEIIVHNKGGHAAVIDGAEATVRNVYALPRCASQDDLPLSETYGLVLPSTAKKGDRVDLALHDQAGPDEADRFAISVSAKVPEEKRGTYFLFEIGLTLHDDAPGRTLPVGTALVALPFVPDEGEYYWNHRTVKLLKTFETGEVTTRELFQGSMPCWRSNTAILRKALSTPATRSKRLDAIANTLVTPSFKKLE